MLLRSSRMGFSVADDQPNVTILNFLLLCY